MYIYIYKSSRSTKFLIDGSRTNDWIKIRSIKVDSLKLIKVGAWSSINRPNSGHECRGKDAKRGKYNDRFTEETSFFLWIDRGIGKSSCALRFILLPSQMRRRSHAQVAGILAWCSRFSFHGFPIRRSLITSVPPDELKSLGSRRKRLRNAARGNPVASGFRGHLTGTMVGRYFLREQDRIFHVTSSRLLFSLSFSFFILFFFPFLWQLCAPFSSTENSLQDGTKVKTKRKRLD